MIRHYDIKLGVFVIFIGEVAIAVFVILIMIARHQGLCLRVHAMARVLGRKLIDFVKTTNRLHCGKNWIDTYKLVPKLHIQIQQNLQRAQDAKDQIRFMVFRKSLTEWFD